MRIPILHLHGGKITEGAIDDSFRHCVTKLASRHFAASEEYAHRIIQLGENPSSVKFVGSLGKQNIINFKPLPKQEFIEQLGLRNLNNEFVFLAVHPETTATMAKSFRLLEYSSTAVLENTDAFTNPSKHFTASPPTSLARAEGEQAGMAQRHRGHSQLNSVLSPTPLPYSSGPQHRSPDSRISLDTHVQMETNFPSPT